MGDYFRHWLKMGKRISETPRIFHVNWFRKDDKGRFIWPGFRENMRILKWIVRARRPEPRRRRPRSAGCRASRTSTGRGSTSRAQTWDEVMTIDRDTWKVQTLQHEELFLKLSDHLPKELIFEREMLVSRL